MSNMATKTSPRREPRACLIHNYLVVWLDENINETDNDYQNSIAKLREVSNTVHTFTDMNECISFINNIDNKKVFIISSAELAQTTVSVVHELPRIHTICIFCADKARHQQWAQQWPKVKGVFIDIISICEALRKAAYECDQNIIPMSFVPIIGEGTLKNLDQLDQSFMCTHILKEILLTIDFKYEHFMAFITYCREQFNDNRTRLGDVHKFEKEYRQHTPIWWYTYDCFLYSTLNCALHAMEVDLIIKLGFFIRSLHEHISRLHSEQYPNGHHSEPFVVYHSQCLSQLYFDHLMNAKGGLLSFNNFLLTSKLDQVSLSFAPQTVNNAELMNILFVITVNPSIQSAPFANVRNAGYYPEEEEEEILFSMHSIFRIEQIKQINRNDRLWQVYLTLNDDQDPQLHALTQFIREETFPDMKGWHRLGKLLTKLGQPDQAERVYGTLLDQTTNETEEANIRYHLGQIKDDQGEYAEAIKFYEKTLALKEKTLPPDHPELATSYNNIGLVYDNMGEYSQALSFHQKALAIDEKTLPPDHSHLATSYCNIAAMYDGMGEYSQALSFHQKALAIRKKTLSPDHSHLATSYSNMGLVYDHMGEFSQALSFYQKALTIDEKVLLPNHSHLATSYSNMGLVYDSMGEYSQALSFHQKALAIREKTLPSDHSSLATSYSNIGLVYDHKGEYSRALSFHHKALAIREKTLPPNHSHLATSYNNIAAVYDSMGEYSQALSFHQKALAIREKTLSPNYFHLATSYSNMGLVYNHMGEYAQALSYHQKALAIDEKTLPPNHPDLATSYNNIALVYGNMGEYSKALSSHRKALAIYGKTLPPYHPNLATSYNNIGKTYYHMKEYHKALFFYEKTLHISEKSLSSNHPGLDWYYNNIGMVHTKMGDDAKALSFYERALDIGQHSLPASHPHLQFYRDNVESIRK